MLAELYRPKTWADFQGNAKAVTAARRIAESAKPTKRGLAFWIDGPSGTGKTTLAHLIAIELGVNEWNTIRFHAGEVTGRAILDLQADMQAVPIGGGYRHIVIDEAHTMKPAAVQALLTVLEPLQKGNLVTFTTTEGRDKAIFDQFDAPLKSRCIELSLTSQGLSELFAARALEIADAAGLGGITAKRAQRIVSDEKNNMRKVIARIEAGDFLAPDAIAA